MWRRRFKNIILPLLIISAVSLVISGPILASTYIHYRSASQADTAQLLGAIEQVNPDFDADQLAEILNNAKTDPSLRQRGFAILRRYGILDEDWSNQDTQKFARQVIIIVIITMLLTLAVVAGYFWWRDSRRAQRLNTLVKYLQDLSQQIYDLRLEENSEDELSLLTNELYKITVTLKEAAEQNRQTREQLENALADISHQLRTPLTSVQTMLDNIYDDPDMPLDVRQDFLRTTVQQVEHMSQLVTTLLNLAKLDNGSIQMRRAKLTIGDLLNTVENNLAILADLNDVELCLQGDLCAQVVLDRRWQTEVLTNIVKNAIEHSGPHSQVTISVRDSALFCKISITDTGEGMSPADRSHLFERFYKAANSKPESVGIGLAFAKAIIEADRGQITVKSELGVGTEFTIRYFK